MTQHIARQYRYASFVLLLISLLFTCGITLAAPSTDSHFILPFLGTGRGDWEASVGVFAWPDFVRFRNLQLRTDVDLLPGIRAHAVVRSNQEFNSLSHFDPHLDEAYLEGFAHYKSDIGTTSASLRVGTTRYLRFPYPDAIAIFDQVPGIYDVKGLTSEMGYQGNLLAVEYVHDSGLGMHYTGFTSLDTRSASSTIEQYLFFRHNLGSWHIESRCGKLAYRDAPAEPLGDSRSGYNAFLGTRWHDLNAGLLYEKLYHEPVSTGVMVQFPLSPATKTCGALSFDYDRTPEGFAMQVPICQGNIGGISRKVPDDAVQVGEIHAERVRTYWQNGQVRNYYEHRISVTGETGSQYLVVTDEQPWYLRYEALVSPHAQFSTGSDITAWESDRRGPAQLCQQVTYRFYKRPKS